MSLNKAVLQHKLIVFYNRDENIYSAVRPGSLNKAVLQHKLIGFLIEMRSVYSTVRTGALNNAVLQHKLNGFYNRDEKCLQRGTDWVFK